MPPPVVVILAKALHFFQGVFTRPLWWGGRVRERVRWLESWLETPGWKVPALTPSREAVLMAWPAGKTDASPQRIAALWAGRVMDDTLDSPCPARAVFRTRI